MPSILSDVSGAEVMIDSPPSNLEDYLVSGNIQDNVKEQSCERYMSISPDNIGEHGGIIERIVTVEHPNDVKMQQFINTLALSGIKILQVTNNSVATKSNSKKKILLLGSHIPSMVYKCPYCSNDLQSQNEYNRHIHNCCDNPTELEDEKLMKCLFCHKDIKRKCMELHMTKHKQQNELRQPKQALANGTKDDKQVLQCRSCFERFISRDEYQIHLKLHPAYICDKCGKGFPRFSALFVHKMTHNEPNSCICEICGKGFRSKHMLKIHLLNHQKKTFQCHICSKAFKRKSQVKEHINYVHKNKGLRLQCAQCSKLFRNRSSYNAHIRLVHQKIKPYKCNICEKQFGRSDYLRLHIARHTGEPKNNNVRRRRGVFSLDSDSSQGEQQLLTCKFCGKSFLDIPKLKKHLETHVKIRRFPCQFCPLTFADQRICKNHELFHKDSEKVFRCNVCWKRLPSEEDLYAHVQTSHKNPKHVCEKCGEKFHRKYLLNHHTVQEHRNPEDTEKAKQIIIDSLHTSQS